MKNYYENLFEISTEQLISKLKEIDSKLEEEQDSTKVKIAEINRHIDTLIAERAMYEGILSGINKSRLIYDEVIKNKELKEVEE